MTSQRKPTALFYCQHAVGMGHLIRSLTLAKSLAEHFRVVFLNGGRMPESAVIPQGVELVNLPAVGYDSDFGLVSHEPDLSADDAMMMRRELMIDVAMRERPDIVIIELFPFGRRKFAVELNPFLETLTMQAPRPIIVSSVRDILVNQRRDQRDHDEQASVRANAFLDAVLVHADPRFATFEESFRPNTPMRVPVHYTGFVAGTGAPVRAATRHDRVIVSAGGGMVGEPLFRTAVAALPLVRDRTGLSMTIVAGPFLPDDAWEWLSSTATHTDGLEVIRHVPDLTAEIAASQVSVSQCGYNTTMDLLRTDTPAIVVPYAAGREDEQDRRAARLHDLGALVRVPDEQLRGTHGGKVLAEAIVASHGRRSAIQPFDLEGSQHTATYLLDVLTNRRLSSAAGSEHERELACS